MTILRFALILVLATLTPPPANAQGLGAENILAPLPEGFEIGVEASDDTQTLMELVPKGETVKDWTRMVTVQVFRTIDNGDPEQFSQTLARLWEEGCPGAETGSVWSGAENGYASNIWLYNCPLLASTGKPESMVAKLIAGADALYSVQYARRAGLDRSGIDEALEYLAGITACDTRAPRHACPPP